MAAVWTMRGPMNGFCILLTFVMILGLTLRGNYTLSQMGLTEPSFRSAATVLFWGIVLVLLLALASRWTGLNEAPRPLIWSQMWKYTIWAMLQQFILQSFFFVRLESLFGDRAGLWAASLFAITHIPSPLLTALSFLGGLFFCEMFRRYRNIFSLGIVHAALGYTIAACFCDSILHRMRVGIAYLRYHP